MEDDSGRGIGRTTRQMQEAPRNSVFVWVNEALIYPKALARKIGREDLEIVSPHWLTERKWMGRELSGLILDHAMNLRNPEQFDSYRRRFLISQETPRAIGQPKSRLGSGSV